MGRPTVNLPDWRAGGRRIITLYRAIAVLILNTLVLLVCLELGARLGLRVWNSFSNSKVNTTKPEYYVSQDWAIKYWEEDAQSHEIAYRPWILWRRAPFAGTMINVDQNGIRETPGADCGESSYKVFTFGGSTMWGSGSPGWATIPGYLQTNLAALKAEPVCVINFGEAGYVSTQSLIQLQLQLQSGNVPDLVIFYDGINDVFNAYRSGLPGAHAHFQEITTKLEGGLLSHVVEVIKASSAFYQLIDRLKPKETEFATYQRGGFDAPGFADAIIQIYLGNYKIVEALARQYDFKYYFFWQPVLVVGKKPLTVEEEFIVAGIDPNLIELHYLVYERVQLITGYDNLYYLADVFDDQASQIYYDYSHVTPVGNELVVQRMLELIENRLNRD